MNDSRSKIEGLSIKTSLHLDDRYSIVINEFLPGAKCHIFNEIKYFLLHSSSNNDIYAQLVRKSDNRVFATTAFYNTSKGSYQNPARGTFGGISIDQPVDLPLLESFVQTLQNFLVSLEAKIISIKLAPSSHNEADFALHFNILKRFNWDIKSHELNYSLPVCNKRFIEHIDHGNRKRIKKCEREGFQCKTLASDEYQVAYNVICENRNRKGFPVTMNYDQIQEMTSLFPERMLFFGCYDNKSPTRMVAASICMRVTDEILYIFYWGDADNMESYSPVALLAQHIYQYCQQENIRILDAGTSTVDGNPNYGLVKFKTALGFSASLKLVFSMVEPASRRGQSPPLSVP